MATNDDADREWQFPYSSVLGGVMIRDFTDEDRSDFIRWARDEAMYEYMAFRFDSDAAAKPSSSVS